MKATKRGHLPMFPSTLPLLEDWRIYLVESWAPRERTKTVSVLTVKTKTRSRSEKKK